MVVIKETVPSLRKVYGKDFIKAVETFSEVIGYSTEKEDDEFRVEFNPDRPDLFSFNLLKRSLGIYYGGQRWEPLRIGAGKDHFLIDSNVRALRPYTVGFQSRGQKIGHHFRELIDYQEKLHLSIGKDRKKVSIGLHDEKSIKFPVTYSARNSVDVIFTTYDGTITGTAKEILEKHPKGMEYAHLIPSDTLVPIIEDYNHMVLSLPPVINGNLTAVSEETSSFFIDITGTDLKAVKEAFFLLSYYFQSLDYDINGSNLDDISEYLGADGRTISLPLEDVEGLLGQRLEARECINLLEKMGYSAREAKGSIWASVPGNRNDVMGPVDVIEDIAKAFGYGNLSLHMPNLDIIGAEGKGNQIASNMRNIMTGLGYQEIMTFVVSTRDHYMNARYNGGVHIRNPKSLDFSVIRDRLYLGVLDFLRLNKRRNLPQMVFEIGEIVSDTEQFTNLCVARISSRTAFSDMKQVLDAIMARTSLGNYEISSLDHENFIPGRTGTIIAKGVSIGYLGEIHPETLDQYELKNPVAILEINISAVSQLIA